MAPSSAPMLQIVARSVNERSLKPSPVYSTILLTPPFTDNSCRIFKITSFADTQGALRPVSLTCKTDGH